MMSRDRDGARIMARGERNRVVSVLILTALLALTILAGAFLFLKGVLVSLEADGAQGMKVTSLGETVNGSEGTTHLLVKNRDGLNLALQLEEGSEVYPAGEDLKVWVIPQTGASKELKAGGSISTSIGGYLSLEDPNSLSQDDVVAFIMVLTTFMLGIILLGAVSVCYAVSVLVLKRQYGATPQEALKAGSTGYAHYFWDDEDISEPMGFYVWVVMVGLLVLGTGMFVFVGSEAMKGGFDVRMVILTGICMGALPPLLLGVSAETHCRVVNYFYARVSLGPLLTLPAQVLFVEDGLPSWLKKPFARIPKDMETVESISETFEGTVEEICKASLLLGPDFT